LLATLTTNMAFPSNEPKTLGVFWREEMEWLKILI
jgi:hypothetical protein